MCCECCGETQRKWWVFGWATIFVALGIVVLVFWPGIAENIVHNNLALKEGSDTYNIWLGTPIPLYLQFTMFNWTNPEEIRNPNVKPKFVEMGPYVFREVTLKENYTFYDNHTVSYYKRRTWYFDETLSNGKLSDMVTAGHAITATVADETRHRNKFIKTMINFILNHKGGELYATKPVGEWIFTGFKDDLIDFLNLFNTTNINIPYKRFAWMADRNSSLTYDGLFTVHTGTDNIYNKGLLTHWNGRTETQFFDLPCGSVNGSTGDLFPPNLNTNEEITIYATDTCRYLNLKPNTTTTVLGLTGMEWVGTNETLDSGENYPNQKCFCNPLHEECPKTGVIDCKKCRNNAPIYASFPHFYLGDDSYRNTIDGMKPDEEKHRFVLAIEPKTGTPLKISARLQINMLIQPDDDYDIYRGIPKVMLPLFWFEQRAELTEELANRAKLALHLVYYGYYLGATLISIGAVMFLIAIYLTITKKWKRMPDDDEDLLIEN